VLPHTPLSFEGTPRIPIEPSHKLGADNVKVFGGWLGHSAEELNKFAQEGVI
jgi:formyl-CoA transferase